MMAEIDTASGIPLHGRVMLIVNGCVQFEAKDADVAFTSVLHDDDKPCEMRISIRHGERDETGRILV